MTDEPARIRPYVITGRNAGAGSDALPLEALVATATGAETSRLAFERGEIAELCRSTPRSVGELAVHLDLPLGVVGLLVADMEATGIVEVRETEADTDLIERLIEGIAAL